MRPSSRCNNSRQIYWGIFPSLKLFKVYIPSIQSISLFQSHPVRHFFAIHWNLTEIQFVIWFLPPESWNIFQFTRTFTFLRKVYNYQNYSRYIFQLFKVYNYHVQHFCAMQCFLLQYIETRLWFNFYSRSPKIYFIFVQSFTFESSITQL